jgi:hypothetical protein
VKPNFNSLKHFQTKYWKLFFLLVLLFAGKLIIAQTDDSTKISTENIQRQLINSGDASFAPMQLNIEYPDFHFNPDAAQTKNVNYFHSEIPGNISDGRIQFRQNKTMNVFPVLGNLEHYNNSFIFWPVNNLMFGLDFGLVNQNTILNASDLNYQFSFGASAEYNITDWFSIYGYGQYVTSKSNFKKVYDPLMYMNPLFLHTEIGSGVRAKYRNIKADIGMKRVFDNQFKNINNINTFNTKVSLKF